MKIHSKIICRNNNNDCFWPAFANLPRSTPSACCNNGGNSYNNRYSNESYENGGNSRCSNGACNDRNNNYDSVLANLVTGRPYDFLELTLKTAEKLSNLLALYDAVNSDCDYNYAENNERNDIGSS